MKRFSMVIFALFAITALMAEVTVNYEGGTTYPVSYEGEQVEVVFETITLVNNGGATTVDLAIDHTAMPEGWMGQWCDDLTCAPWFLDEWTISLAENSEYNIYIHVFINSEEGFPFTVTFSGANMEEDVTYNFNIAASGSSSEDVTVLPSILSQNYPNPFNPTTTINYSLAADSNGEMTIFNIKGEVVKTFEDLAGENSVTWNGNDDNGNAVASGIYYYRLNGGTQTVTKKMILMK